MEIVRRMMEVRPGRRRDFLTEPEPIFRRLHHHPFSTFEMSEVNRVRFDPILEENCFENA
jgi:hypothetical protein